MKLKGNLTLNPDASGEIRNVYIERLASAPEFNGGEQGRIYFNTSNSLYYFNNGAAWVVFGTGQSDNALQGEVDAIKQSLGPIVNADGTFNGPNALDGIPFIASSQNLTDALILLANATSVNSNTYGSLEQLNDVEFTTLVDGQFLKFDTLTGQWNNKTLQVSDISDIRASSTEINVLHGTTLTSEELNHVAGVTSNIQEQLLDKQPLNNNLSSISNVTSDGILCHTTQGNFSARTLQAPLEGITINNPGGVRGDPTFVLTNDLASIERLSTLGIAVRVAHDTWTTRSINGADGRITIAYGNGISSDILLDLQTVPDNGVGLFKKLSTDSFGRVTGTQNVTSSDLTSIIDGVYLTSSGGNITGDITLSGGATIRGVPNPINGTDVVNKNYADSLSTGLIWKIAVQSLAASNISIASAPIILDDHTLVNGDRILLVAQTNPYENGIYIFNGAGSPLARSSDADNYSELNAAAVFVQYGTLYASTGWTQTATTTSLTAGQTQVWNQFTASSSYTWGSGLGSNGNTISINMGAGIFDPSNDSVSIDLYSPDNSALFLTSDGTTRSSSSNQNAKLHLLLKTGGGLSQSADGLFIADGQVSNNMLVNHRIILSTPLGVAFSELGESLTIDGDYEQGIITSGNNITTIKVSAFNASTTSKGVAKFDPTNFEADQGYITLKANSVTNSQLANTSFLITADTGSGAIYLGDSLSFKGSASGVLSTTFNDITNAFTFDVRDATYSNKGVAKFSSTDFNIIDGTVSLAAQGIGSLTDINIDVPPTVGSTLVWNNSTSKFVPRNIYYLYMGASNATHTVNHNLGQKYCNVTVVNDTNDEVIMPQSIKFNNNNTLTVSFSSAMACKIIVMGVPTTFA